MRTNTRADTRAYTHTHTTIRTRYYESIKDACEYKFLGMDEYVQADKLGIADFKDLIFDRGPPGTYVDTHTHIQMSMANTPR